MFERFRAKESKTPRIASEPYSFLPAPKAVPLDPPDPPTEGWWNDPVPPPGPKKVVAQRYHDGTRWTPYVSVRSSRRWTDVLEVPVPESSQYSRNYSRARHGA